MDTVEEIKSKLNIVDVISRYVELKKAGRNHKGVCPFHSEKTPSFMVNQDLQIYKCFGCNKAGDMFNFVQEIEGIEFPEALKMLGDMAGVEVKQTNYDPNTAKKNTIYEINHLASEFFHFVLHKHPSGKKALDYLTNQRKISSETIKEFKIGYAPNSWDSLFKFLVNKKYSAKDIFEAGLVSKRKSGDGYYDKFRGRVMFPLVGINNKVLGFTGRTLEKDGIPKYMNTPETLVFHKSNFLFGFDKAKVAVKQDGAVLVEGQVDVITAFQAGIKNVIASSGTALTQAQLQTIARYTKDLTFCFDSDSAGIAAIQRAIEIATKQDFNIKVAVIPEKFKDLDEMVLQDSDSAKRMLENSVSVYEFFLHASLKQYNKNDPIDKKKIASELVPIYKNIKNPITRDHFIKRLAEILEISETALIQLKTGESNTNYETSRQDNRQQKQQTQLAPKKQLSTQAYLLTLLMRTQLDTAQTVLYKLGKHDFTDANLLEIFENYKEYTLGRKRKVDIKSFSKKLNTELSNLVNDLYLWDLGDLDESSEKFLQEVSATYTRLKKETIKRELKKISQEIKEAEKENNSDLIEELTAKFKELSEKLV